MALCLEEQEGHGQGGESHGHTPRRCSSVTGLLWQGNPMALARACVSRQLAKPPPVTGLIAMETSKCCVQM